MTLIQTKSIIDREGLALNEREDMDIQFREIAGQKVMIIDRIYKHPDYVRELALSLDFHIPRGQYPGHFALISLVPHELLEFVNEVYTRPMGFRIDHQMYCRDMTFAMVDKREEDLSFYQSQPHHDNICDFAGVLYLSPEPHCHGGTSFWRHKSTGLQLAPTRPHPSYQPLLERFALKDEKELLKFITHEGAAETEKSYIQQSSKYWEFTDLLEMKYNRLVMYNANLFHTPHFTPENFGGSKEERRLTQNLYCTIQEWNLPSNT